jgi:ribosomal protein S18 acetylase RimI-like enzyme
MYPLREADVHDIPALLRLEAECFDVDRLSKRSFKRWLLNKDRIFLVHERQGHIVAYILVILIRGTRLARLYSMAVAVHWRRQGVASAFLIQAEKLARDDGKLYLRLEVALDNQPAIRLYEKFGYRQFGLYKDYYANHQDALRMEKCIHRFEPEGNSRIIPWLAQTTPFSCGPASLMMAMSAFENQYEPTPLDEIEIWRSATTIYMTSGHGGCHPFGLALAAIERGFAAEIWVNQDATLFIEGVRNPQKKRVIDLVHQHFLQQVQQRNVPVHYEEMTQVEMVNLFEQGANILILISTYRLDRKKVPHWVVMSGYDDACLYFHDPDLDDEWKSIRKGKNKNAIDCQHLPIARDQLDGMTRYGGNRLRCAVVIRPPSFGAIV